MRETDVVNVKKKKVNEARQNLIVYENLLERLCSLMNIQIEENDDETADLTAERKIEAVFDKMWKFNQTYKLLTEKLVSIFSSNWACI